MPRETQSPPELQGVALKTTIQQYLQERVSELRQINYPSVGFVQACSDHLDELGINWNRPRNTGEIRSFIGSLTATFRYAHAKTGGEFLDFFKPLTPDKQWDFIKQTLEDPHQRQIVHENLWRPPTTAYPERSIPLPFLLNHHFGNKSLTAIDFGAGAHIGLPLLPLAESIIGTDFPEKKNCVALCLSSSNHLWTWC
jgi:hypothetical protein